MNIKESEKEKEYCISGFYSIVIKAESEEEAEEFAFEVCENDTIPVEPEDLPEIFIEGVFEHEDEMLEH